MSQINWPKLKAEYIRTTISLRKLAQKYSVSPSTLMKRAVSEKWADLRNQKSDIVDAKIVESAASAEAQRALRIQDVADQLLRLIAEEVASGVVSDPMHIRQLTASLKDLKDIKGYKTDLDLEEQRARIEKLKADIRLDKEIDEKTYGVVMLPPVDEIPEVEADG